ncbi:hypothetical protein [Adlercreutzia rubneri]
MSIYRIEIPSWRAPRSAEYGAEIRATVENGGAVLGANDAGLAELALTALSLAGPGVPAGTWVEVDEYGGALAEGSMPVILTRTDSSAGEEGVPWSLLLDSASAGSGVDGLGVDAGQGELAIYGDGAALAGFGRWLLLAGPCSGLPAAAPPREAPPVGAPDALSLRRVASNLDAGQYPAVWEVGSRRPAGCRERLDYEVDDGGRRWLSARALRELDGLLSGCALAIGAPGGSAELLSVPTIDCLVPSRETGAPSEGGRVPRAIACSSLEPGVGLFAIAEEPEGCLFATNYLVDRAMRGRLLGFEFRALWTSGAERSPRLLSPVGERRLAPLSPAPSPMRMVQEDDEGRS